MLGGKGTKRGGEGRGGEGRCIKRGDEGNVKERERGCERDDERESERERERRERVSVTPSMCVASGILHGAGWCDPFYSVGREHRLRAGPIT